MSNFLLLIKVLLLYHSICTLATASRIVKNPKPRKLESFVTNLINKRFRECTLLTLQDSSEYDTLFDYFVQNTNINFFNVKFTEENYTLSKSLPVIFPITVGNYHRKSNQCLIAVLMLSHESPEFFQQIFDTITPVYIPITRKDEDHYIFITKYELIDSVLLNNQLPMKIKFKLGISEKQDGSLSVRSVCFFCDEGNPIIKEFSEDGVQDYFPDYVLNLNGKTLRITVPKVRSKMEVDAPWTGISNARRGNWKLMLEEFLMIKFNFTYNAFISSGFDGNSGGGGTGVQLENGTWIGITGDILSGKAQLGIIIASTAKRMHYIDFTNSFYDIGCLTFVTAEGKKLFSPAALLWPFDIGMWGCMGLSTALSFLFFTCLTQIMKIFHLGDKESWSLPLQIRFIIASFLDQGTNLPRFTPLRFFVALWLFFTMIATNIYRSKMVSLIAFPVVETIPKTFEELAYSDYQVGFMKHGDSAYNTLAASSDPVYVKLVSEMEIDKGIGLDCLQKVVKHKYGCIAYDFAIRHLLERNLSDSESRKLVFAPSRTYNIWLGLGLEGKSIYKINFGKWLSYTRSFYLADIWDKKDMYYNVRLLKKQWWLDTNQKEKAKTTEAAESSDLTLKHFSGAFYVLLGGLMICASFFIGEIVYFKMKTLKTMITDFKPIKSLVVIVKAIISLIRISKFHRTQKVSQSYK